MPPVYIEVREKVEAQFAFIAAFAFGSVETLIQGVVHFIEDFVFVGAREALVAFLRFKLCRQIGCLLQLVATALLVTLGGIHITRQIGASGISVSKRAAGKRGNCQ